MERERRVLKNAKLVALEIENFNEWINREDNLFKHLGHIGCHEWYLNIEKFSEGGVDYLSVQVSPEDIRVRLGIFAEALSTELAFYVKNESPERWEKCQGRFEVGHLEWVGWHDFMRMDTILDPNSGFLRDDGSLMVQVEIRVDYVTYKDRINGLNFFDPFKGSVEIKTGSRIFYGRKQMLMFHSPVLAEQLADGRDEIVVLRRAFPESVDLFLQFIHGVKGRFTPYHILDVLYLAHKYQVLTVLRQLEVYIKNYSDEEIRRVIIHKNTDWIKKLMGEQQDFVILNLQMSSCKYEELQIGKKEMLLAITRAPFAPDLDCSFSEIKPETARGIDGPSETESKPQNRSKPSSIFHFLSRTFKRITSRRVNKV